MRYDLSRNHRSYIILAAAQAAAILRFLRKNTTDLSVIEVHSTDIVSAGFGVCPMALHER